MNINLLLLIIALSVIPASVAQETSKSAPQTSAETALNEGNTEQALSIISKAAFAGQPWAEEQLGDINVRGELVPQSLVHAVDWYNRAAASGSVSALTKLALLFCDKKLPKVMRAAKCLNTLNQAAGKGSPLAQYEFAKITYSNQFGSGDVNLAKSLAAAAAKQNIAKANQLLKKIAQDTVQFKQRVTHLDRATISNKFKRSTHTIRLASFKRPFDLRHFVLTEDLDKNRKLYTYQVGNLHVLAQHYYRDEQSAQAAIKNLSAFLRELKPQVVPWQQISKNITQ